MTKYAITACSLSAVLFVVIVARQKQASANGSPTDSATGSLTIEYSNDFESGASDWQFVDAGDWKVADRGTNRVLSLFKKKGSFTPQVRSLYHLAMLKEHSVSDFQMDVRLLSTEPDYGHRDACLIFGYQSPTRYYYIHLGKKTDDTAHQIHLVNDKDRSAITIKNNAGTPWDDQWHYVRVTRNATSGKIAVYFDDMQTASMTAQDTTFSWGRVGLGSFDDIADFDDFRLSGKAAASPVDAQSP